MELATTYSYIGSNIEDFTKQVNDLNLTCYASEAAAEMEFKDIDEFHEAVQRAMELCLYAGIPLEKNFRRVYKCSSDGIMYDWKLSILAYLLVCLNGSATNSSVAKMQIELLRHQFLDL